MWQFEHIEYLWGLLLLIPLAILFIVLLRWKKRGLSKLGNAGFTHGLAANHSNKKFKLKILLIFVAIAASIVGLANLRKPNNNNNTTTNGIDVMIALDVSKSMLSQDEKPTRLDKAKQFIHQLSQGLQNNNIGLVVFAGEAFLQMPLTNDIAASKIFIGNASTDLVGVQGTAIGDALLLCNASLDTKTKQSKAVVLITDGDDHDNKAIDAAKQLAEQGAVVYTVGVGSLKGAPIIENGTQEYKRDKNGETVITKLNETLLKEIATHTNGNYYTLDNVSTVANNVTTALNSLQKKSISNTGGTIQFNSWYMYFVALAILLLMLELFISERKKTIA
jgi:Ca-activated chloride channel family protein